jgi:murein DD-endopeptidase MepM/ murein hydrolase activator NlpD
MPAQGPITTEFGEVRAYNDGPFNSWHNGLDIGADEGAPIVALAPGRVVYAGRLDIRGNFTAIDHGLGILTCYFHQSEILVQVGQTVQAGDLIGRVGTTGLSTGPHLHWEVRVEGIPVSPWQWVEGAGVR